ncbi:hypothetical protein ACIRP2_21485 [Streptomyces sp. NPDC101194]|uniref:hypothetical protein n=1 Tax=Streptomyces sp. NPDC101194 TaxID=3366127 RepID=UPI0038230C3D
MPLGLDRAPLKAILSDLFPRAEHQHPSVVLERDTKTDRIDNGIRRHLTARGWAMQRTFHSKRGFLPETVTDRPGGAQSPRPTDKAGG